MKILRERVSPPPSPQGDGSLSLERPVGEWFILVRSLSCIPDFGWFPRLYPSSRPLLVNARSETSRVAHATRARRHRRGTGSGTGKGWNRSRFRTDGLIGHKRLVLHRTRHAAYRVGGDRRNPATT